MEKLEITNSWYHLRRLIEILNHESRFILPEPYKNFVDTIIEKIHDKFISVVPANSKFYRARINKFNFEKIEHEKTPFPSEEMGCPPRHLAIPGRINPEGIPYLYCAGELDTAAAELRPWKGSYLTIGEVDIMRNITIVDLTLDFKDMDSDWTLFFYDFSEMFSIQWPPELKLNYLITQYFSEHFKAIGLGGIKYKSVFNLGGNNYALFYKEDYSINTTYSVETSEIDYFFYKNKDL